MALTSSLVFLCGHPALLGLSLALFALTGLITWAAYQAAISFIDGLIASFSFFSAPPEVRHFWDWPLLWGWTALKWTIQLVSGIIAFYLAFLLAYTLTTPGYALLSTWAGNRFTPRAGEGEAALSLGGILTDLLEGLKIGAFGLVVTLFALALTLIPVFGQIAVFVLYVFYSALMFIDFPASRYRWHLGQKLHWLWLHRGHSFRLGLLPALVSMAPLVNIFLMALCFPVFTVHSTLNFLAIEEENHPS